MAHRFNYTKRDKIRLEDIEVKTARGKSPLTVFLKVNFSRYLEKGTLKAEDLVVFEAHRRTKASRRPLGTVGAMPSSQKVEFVEFPNDENVLFRLRVIEPETRLVKGMAKRITPANKPEEDGPMDSIIQVSLADPEDGLGERLWKVTFNGGSLPTVLLSGKRFATPDASRTAPFQALVWPEILQEILLYTFVVRAFDPPPWKRKWIEYSEEVLGVPDPPADAPDDAQQLTQYFQDAYRWIDEAVRAFCSRRNLDSVSIPGVTKEDRNV